MKEPSVMNALHSPHDPRILSMRIGFRMGICAALLLMAGHAHAQTIYRVVGADGKISFSDKPPATADKSTVTGTGSKAVSDSGAALPFELRQVTSQYPVTLYTASNCAPCNSGRTLLSGRGIPFTEKTITTPDDTEALQRLSGDNSLPFMTIGGQQLKGFSEAEWVQFLDAAGYPKSSQLPPGYRHSAATPLVVLKKPAPVAKPDDALAPVAPKRVPVDAQSNPAGITF